MSEPILVNQPANPQHLYLLFHGVGSQPQSMAPLAKLIAATQPEASVICVAAPYAFDLAPGGRQWFSVKNVTEENRPQRVEQAMGEFIRCIKNWQAVSDLGAENTTLIGFSQGAIMALSMTQMVDKQPAARIFALSGRFAAEPSSPAKGVRIHLLHGRLDRVMDVRQAEQSFAQLKALNADVTLDIFDDLEHGISHEEAMRMQQYLREEE